MPSAFLRKKIEKENSLSFEVVTFMALELKVKKNNNKILPLSCLLAGIRYTHKWVNMYVTRTQLLFVVICLSVNLSNCLLIVCYVVRTNFDPIGNISFNTLFELVQQF